MSTRILIADDHQLMREGLRALLERASDFEVVGEAGDGRTLVKLARELSPDVLIVDISMPGLNGIEATRKVLEVLPEAEVLALSMHPERRYVVEMLKAGASGYVLKRCTFEELSQAVRTVCSGGIYLSPGVAGTIVKDYLGRLPETGGPAYSALSPREREILQLLAEGQSTKEVAASLHVSISTIETHRRHIMGKLNIHSIAELTKFALREGLTSLE